MDTDDGSAGDGAIPDRPWAGESDLMRAVMDGDAAAAEAAMADGADPLEPDRRGWSALEMALRLDEPQLAMALLRGRAPDSMLIRGETPLMLVAGMGSLRCLRALLPLSDPRCAKDGSGWTALMDAAYLGEPECVAILAPLSDLDAKTRQGQTARELALEEGFPECASAIDAERARREAEAIVGGLGEPGAADGSPSSRRPKAL